MNQLLVKQVDVWSVARTVFPLLWLVHFILSFVTWILISHLVGNLAHELTGYSIISGGIGIVMIVTVSLIFGFSGAVLTTLIAVLMAVLYNFLARLGGGITLNLAEIPTSQESGEGEAAMAEPIAK